MNSATLSELFSVNSVTDKTCHLNGISSFDVFLERYFTQDFSFRVAFCLVCFSVWGFIFEYLVYTFDLILAFSFSN